MHASCESPWHFSAKHHFLAACFPLMVPFRTRFSPYEMARTAYVQRLIRCLYTLWYCYIPTCRFTAQMVVSPGMQAGINAVFICVHKCTWSNGLFDNWLNGFLLHIRKHADDHLTTPLNHPKDWRPLFVQCATTTWAFASVATSFSPLVLYHLRLSFMACNHIRFVALHLVRQGHFGLFFTMPSR